MLSACDCAQFAALSCALRDAFDAWGLVTRVKAFSCAREVGRDKEIIWGGLM